MKHLPVVKATVSDIIKKTLKPEEKQNPPYDFFENFCFFASDFWENVSTTLLWF